ncbi:MAG: hypothetical protein NW216_11410 [Hyphomicrobium sp.]|nr:hypothetical protein [Hyphomicrobium sp.]
MVEKGDHWHLLRTMQGARKRFPAREVPDDIRLDRGALHGCAAVVPLVEFTRLDVDARDP